MSTALVQAPLEEHQPEVPLSAGREADFRGRRRLVTLCAVAAFATGVLSVLGTVLLSPVRYRASTLVFSIEGQARYRRVEFSERRLQSVASIARSDTYAAQLQRLSGVDTPVGDISAKLAATRPSFGGVVSITFTSRDQDLVDRIRPVMLRALATTVEQVRDAAISGSGQVGDLSAEVYSDIPGRPLYYEPFGEPSTVELLKPPLAANFLIGSFLGVLLTPAGVLLAHRRRRVDSGDGLSELLASPSLLHIPQPTALGSRGDRRVVRAFAEQILSDRGGRPRVVALVGDDLPGMRRRIGTALALSMAAAGEDPVLLMDLADSWWSTRWRSLTGREVRRRRRLRRGVRPWKVPVSLWGEWAAQRRHVSTIADPIGPRRFGVELADRILTARHRTTIVAVLPDTPGRYATDEVLGVSDLVVQVVLDGWTIADRASLCRQLLETSAPGRSRVLVVEN